MTGNGDRPIRVLNVDDDETARYVKSEQLRRAGYKVVEVATGKAALEAAIDAEFDVIVLDVKLPVISGYDVCRILKESPRTASVPVLQVSALLVDDDHRAEGLDAGADSYLAAPFTTRVFLATVRALVRARLAETMLADALERERQSRLEAETATRLKDQFLATVSHELRTPLNTMAGWLWRLRQPGVTSAVLERGLASLERSTATQTRMIEDLLDVARIVSGKLCLNFAPVALGDVVRTAAEMLQTTIERKSLELAVAITPENELHGDAARLQQVVVNLLSNAVRFTPDGGRIEVRVERANDTLKLIVTDTGMGIAARDIPHIFEPFRQAADQRGPRNAGLGLGLTIVRQIATMHGGRVTVQSAGSGQGATFTVELPVSGSPAGRNGVNEAHATTLSGIRVLVVEDDDDARELTTAMLTAAGGLVVAAASAADALAICRTDRFDVLVTDIGLPDIDGYELLRQVRAAGVITPAIAVTAYATQADEDRAKIAGFAAHIAKPIQPQQLVDAVARAAVTQIG